MNGLSMREKVKQRHAQSFKCVRVVTPRNLAGNLAMLLTCAALFAQVAFVAAAFAVVSFFVPVFWYISLCLTAATGAVIFVRERDMQCKTGWLMIMLVSFGCGYIIYLLANKSITYGGNKSRFDALYKKSQPLTSESKVNAVGAVANDCNYLYSAGGFKAYTGTDIKYFGEASEMFDKMLIEISRAEKFVFIESFILADGELFGRLLKLLKRKAEEGVEVRLLYDDAGSAATLRPSTRRGIEKSGIKLARFSKLLSPFYFGLNFRDHRKIVVIDGKTGFVCGCNFADECVNARRTVAHWKDAGVRIDGCAVDSLSLMFLRQWDFTVKREGCWDSYLNLCESTKSLSVVVPFAGGPDLSENVCRGAYASVIRGAREKLFIMTPYLNPDGEFMNMLKEKAMSGVDIRVVLPSVPDWKFLYKITIANAEKLIKSGVKVYYAPRTFIHSKVILSESCAIVGSINIDMRTFYQEFDNGIYTNDGGVLREINSDFNGVFALTPPAAVQRRGVVDKCLTGILKIFSPLM